MKGPDIVEVSIGLRVMIICLYADPNHAHWCCLDLQPQHIVIADMYKEVMLNHLVVLELCLWLVNLEGVINEMTHPLGRGWRPGFMYKS